MYQYGGIYMDTDVMVYKSFDDLLDNKCILGFEEENYRREFTDALKNFVDMGDFKYPIYTDKIYESIFREKSAEYRRILKLEKKDKTRDTFYS